MAVTIGRDLTYGFLTLQAMSLVYSTLLPLGNKGDAIATQLIAYVDDTDVRVPGPPLDLAFSLYPMRSLISKIEQVFNYTRHVEEAEPLVQRFS